jgi:formamidopyrimidine-DNA glycosylase
MPEYPDIQVYEHCIARRAVGSRLNRLRIGNPFVLRSVAPGPEQLTGRVLRTVGHLGKRLVLGFDDEYYAVIHLMILGRPAWKPAGAKLARGSGLAAFDFDGGSLMLTESGSKRRAALHLVQGAAALAAHDRGGLEITAIDFERFAAQLAGQAHTLKRVLSDPSRFSGIGNAYSDEILHRARMSPFKRADRLEPAEQLRLYEAARAVLESWAARLQAEAEAAGGWPPRVTAFRPEMAVHGRYRQPCPECGAPVQRIVYSDNESNYCARCQTGDRLLADRALSRLLHDSWPKTLED